MLGFDVEAAGLREALSRPLEGSAGRGLRPRGRRRPGHLRGRLLALPAPGRGRGGVGGRQRVRSGGVPLHLPPEAGREGGRPSRRLPREAAAGPASLRRHGALPLARARGEPLPGVQGAPAGRAARRPGVAAARALPGRRGRVARGRAGSPGAPRPPDRGHAEPLPGGERPRARGAIPPGGEAAPRAGARRGLRRRRARPRRPGDGLGAATRGPPTWRASCSAPSRSPGCSWSATRRPPGRCGRRSSRCCCAASTGSAPSTRSASRAWRASPSRSPATSARGGAATPSSPTPPTRASPRRSPAWAASPPPPRRGGSPWATSSSGGRRARATPRPTPREMRAVLAGVALPRPFRRIVVAVGGPGWHAALHLPPGRGRRLRGGGALPRRCTP